MKKLISLFGKAVVVSSLATTMVCAQTGGKFAIVDMKKAFDSYYKTKQAEGQIKDRAADSFPGGIIPSRTAWNSRTRSAPRSAR